MKKRAVMIMMTVILSFTSALSPVCLAAASDDAAQEETGGAEDTEKGDKSILEQGMETASDLYDKVDEKLDGVDKVSLRREIREALEQMDEMGISPTAVAENLFGIRPASGSSGKKPGDKLIEEAERTVRKSTEGFFTVLWEGFLDTLGNMITTGISVFGSQEGHSAKGGSSR
ncbi:MAG: hypothetical protein IJ198_02185 [Lachnospiraceae bacterium]|nr:hypothetical protein [Lachnospiraceae bacterium]